MENICEEEELLVRNVVIATVAVLVLSFFGMFAFRWKHAPILTFFFLLIVLVLIYNERRYRQIFGSPSRLGILLVILVVLLAFTTNFYLYNCRV